MRHVVFPIAVWMSMASSCGEPVAPSIPPAELYRVPSNFEGVWIGEVGAVMGTFEVEQLDQGKYRGRYVSDDTSTEYVMSLDQSMLAAEEGGERVGANRVVFTWQDGRGGRGRGWLLINEEDSALTGESYFGDEGGSGLAWQFIRIE